MSRAIAPLLRGLCCVLLPLVACHPVTAPDPLPSTLRYLELVTDGQIDAAYGMLSEGFRRRCDRACFVHLLDSQRIELLQARAQVRDGEARVSMTAELPLQDGTVLKLVQPAEGASGAQPTEAPAPYLFAHNPLDFYPQDTPEHALHSFMRAVESRRYGALLRFLPQALEEQYTLETLQKRFDGPGRTELLAKLAIVRQHLSEPFTYDKEGHSASLPLGENKEARVVFEDGRWRVLQLE